MDLTSLSLTLPELVAYRKQAVWTLGCIQLHVVVNWFEELKERMGGG